MSIVIKTAIDVKKAELLAKGVPLLGLTIDNVEHTIVKLDPLKNSELIKHVSHLTCFIPFCSYQYRP